MINSDVSIYSYCPLCGQMLAKYNYNYRLCSNCEILISTVAAEFYEEDYYYLKDTRDNKSKIRAKFLFDLFKDNFGENCCLDFGCNIGTFVEYANKNGVSFEGVDVSNTAINIARRLGGGTFYLPTEQRGKTYNTITAFDVIEHFDCIDHFFREIEPFMAESSKIIVTTPNFDSRWIKIFDDSWHGFGIPQYHRYIFGRKVIENIFQLHGYTCEKIFSILPPPPGRWKLLLGSGYRLKKNKFEKLLSLPQVVLKILSGLKKFKESDDTLCVIAKKINI